MTYTIINSVKTEIAPYFNRASIQHKIDGLSSTIEALQNDEDSSPAEKANILKRWENTLRNLETKLKNTRY